MQLILPGWARTQVPGIWLLTGLGGGGTIPDSADQILISSNATNNLVLDGNRKITNLTLSSKTIDLNGYSLTVYGTATMTSGTVTNGTFYARGNLASFNGTLMDCPVDAVCGYIRLSGSTFNETADFTDLGAATGTGAGGCTFNGDVTITHTGTLTYFTLANTTGDTFNGNVTFTNSSNREIHIASSGATLFNGNVILNSTSSGGISIANGGGSATLATGKTISIGSSGFSADFLTLKNFTQNGSTAQTLTLTGTAVVNMIAATFNGNLTITAPGILLKNSTFNGSTTLTRNGSSGNHQSDGGNTFNTLTLDNAGSTGRVRWATTLPDNYNADATFNSTGGQDVQIAYSGDNTFAGNITINSNKVVFNTNTGKVTFTGTNNQTLNGSYNYPFKKLTINKSAGTVTANTTLSVDDSLIFIQGNLITTSTNLLTMKHGSTATGASNSSFVSGPVKKVGNSAFVFDVGTGTTYRPLTITAPSNTTDAFTAEYYSVGQTLGSTKDTTITFVSDCGYWKLDRIAGSSNITPKFAFDSVHCDYLTVKPVHIALWNGTKWTDKGEAVTESTNKTTSTSMTSYGYFAFAYNLVPGDAPQMPYMVTTTSNCNSVELQFTSNDMWFSFTPDSAVIKACFLSPEINKNYAVIKEAIVYNAYTAGNVLSAVDSMLWPFDSTLVEYQSYRAILTPSNQYLLKVSRFISSDGPGIYDTTDYFVDVCIINSRMAPQSQVIEYYTAADLFQRLGSVDNPFGNVFPGDVLIPGSGVTAIDISAYAPLLIEGGVTLCGNYDLLFESFNAVAVINSQQVNTSPNGTLITCQNRGQMAAQALDKAGYMFYMKPGAILRNIRLEGAMPGYQDYNFDDQLCAGVRVDAENSNDKGPFHILNSEIYNFSYAGIYVDALSDNITVDKCQVHHVKGGGGTLTTSKGYGFWLQGGDATNNIVTNATIERTIIDEAKEGIDSQPNPINITVDNCTFGEHFVGENYTRHRFNVIYLHSVGSWTPPNSNCYYYTSQTTNNCEATKELISSNFNTEAAAGNTDIKNSIFHQKGESKFIISIPYPANPFYGTSTTRPLFNTEVVNNTFAKNFDAPGSLTCNVGGYFRLDDNYAPSCTWDYERAHNTNRELLSSVPAPSNTKPILVELPNVFDYQPGNPVASASSPQPPELNLKFTDTAGEIKGINESIPYININDNIAIEISPGSNGSQLLSYIVRPQTNNQSAIGSLNTSGNNSYTDEQFTTSPTSGTYSHTFSSSDWETSLPGLYGIDVVAVDGNSNSNYHTSAWEHKPIVVAPATNYWLIFNIKDSWYSTLNPTASIGDIYKQVELNGHPIWREKITEGGDGWERVAINLSGQYPSGTDILSYININNIQNQLSFSIAIDNPASIATADFRGLKVWVDDIYLKKFDHQQNLILDGDVEATTDVSELGSSPQSDCIWYADNLVSFIAPCTSIKSADVDAETKAFITTVERKSGKRALELNLDGLVSSTTCMDFSSFTPLLPTSNAMVSACVDFDYRDLITCSDLATLGYENFSTYCNYILASPCSIKSKNILVDQDIVVGSGITLFIEGSNIAISSNASNPIQIIVNSGGTLKIGASAKSRIFACNDMWQGIENNGGTVDMWTGSKINEVEDAIAAISSDGGTVKIRNALFDNNRTALEFQNYSNTPVVSSNSDGILAVNFSNSDGTLTKEPHRDSPVYAHINLLDNVNIRIGSIGNNAYLNKFSNALNGIRSSNSSAYILHAEFDQMIENISHKKFGYGCIFTENNSQVTVGGVLSNSLYQVKFSSSSYGIVSRNSTSIIEGNKFETVGHGIAIINPVSATINDNELDNTNFLSKTGTGFNNCAILVKNDNDVTVDPVYIYKNSIIDYRLGIFGLLTNGIKIGTDALDNLSFGNTITYSVDAFPVPFYHGGIWLQQCPNAMITDNVINNTHFNVDPNFRGIDLENSLMADINCNSVSNFGIGINFDAHCDDTELRQNTLTDFDIGVNINNSKIALNQGVFGGTPDGPNAWDNQWFMTGTNTNQFKVGGITLDQTKINWYHQNGDVPTNQHSPNPFPLVLVLPDVDETTAPFTCASTLRIIGDRVVEFGSVIGDSTEYVENSELNTYLARVLTYQAMKLDTTIIYQGDSLDADFETFFETHESTNIGKFDLVKSLIEREPDSAMAILEFITPDNNIESYLIEHFQRTRDIADRGDELSSSDSAFYMERTVGSPTTDGEVYYYGFGNLFIEQHLPILSARIGQQPTIEQPITVVNNKSEMLIFPNPTTGVLNIRLSEQETKLSRIEIYNSMGELVISKEIANNHYKIDMSSYNQGIYFIRGVDQSKKYYSKSFNLLK
jgi:hypothetical protein